MKRRDLIYKSIISTFLVLALFAFKIADLHSYTHDTDSKKPERCELCLLAHNNKTGEDFIPVSEHTFEFINIPVDNILSFYEGIIIWKSAFFRGKSLNKAPPAVFV